MRLDKRWLALGVLVAAVVLFFAFDLGQYLNLTPSRRARRSWKAGAPQSRCRPR